MRYEAQAYVYVLFGVCLFRRAGVAELADAPDLGSGVLDVQVQVLSPAPLNMREWLSGRASPCQGERREFESRLPLHISRCDGIGRRNGLKIRRWQHRVGSTPTIGTKIKTIGKAGSFDFIKEAASLKSEATP